MTKRGLLGLVLSWGLALSCLLLLSCKRQETSSQDDAPIKVAAAADLAKAFEEVGASFENKTSRQVTFTFGSTGLLAKQLQEGAPFDVFAAANVSFVEDVIKAGACFEPTKALYARGRIVVWTKSGEPIELTDLVDPKYAKIAIANPEHAPYGKAAQQALEKAGLWDELKPRLVYGENVLQTLQYAQSGNADAAIVALSIALGSRGVHTLVDVEQHAPLDQALVVCKGDKRADATSGRPAAQEFAEYVNSAEGRAIMRRYGFMLPGESVATDGQ